MQKEIINYGGFNFTRYPNSKNKTNRVYFSGWIFYKGEIKKTYLHRFKWTIERGEIPKGFHIHHKDGDTINNEIDNYECMEGRAHLSYTNKNVSPELKQFRIDTLRKHQYKSAKWHKSKKGSEWHKQHGRNTFIGSETKRKCLECGKEFISTTKYKEVKWCGHKCKVRVAARIFRARRAGLRFDHRGRTRIFRKQHPCS